MKIRKKLIGWSAAAVFTGLAFLPLLAAFEAHVVNVTATIENALFVHPEDLEFDTVFPQEHLFSSFFIGFSNSFSTGDQRRVGRVDYVIKQKPEPREVFRDAVGVEAARDWCHLNSPANAADPNDPYYQRCYPNLCPYLSKHPDNFPSSGPNAFNDVGVPPFHDPDDPNYWPKGKLVKYTNPPLNTSTIGNDPSDVWTVDLAVPCFKGQCAQDWETFVLGLNPNAGDPEKYKLPQSLEHQKFACDLWVEVTNIY